ncbi:MAG: ATP-binding cassette domain-containing protein [Planctomycetota bacterium]
MADVLLELENVAYQQQTTEILRGIDWKIEQGSRWALLGPNGSGKTTLIKVATGQLWQSSGVVRRLGRELTDLSVLRERTGWVSADLLARVPPNEKALATVVSGRRGQVGLRRIGNEAWPTERDFADARATLNAMGLSKLADKPIRVLSQGERQQVLVARAKMNCALLLVLDEPCAGMDPGTRERFLAWLGDQLSDSQNGSDDRPAVVMITHQVEEVLPEFDRVMLMGTGRVVASGPPDEVLTPNALSETYGVDIDRIEHSSGRHWPIWSPAR